MVNYYPIINQKERVELNVVVSTDSINAAQEAILEKRVLLSPRDIAKAKTRKAIMRSALQLYSLEGMAGMSMNRVAKGANIAQPSFYNHFDSLEQLQYELSAQLKNNYLSPMRAAWVAMIKDYVQLDEAQFNLRCQHCLTLIFDAAFVNIELFQRLMEDRLRFSPSFEDKVLATDIVAPNSLITHSLITESPASNGSNKGSKNSSLGGLIDDIQDEWTQIFIEGLSLSGRSFDYAEVNLCVDMAAAQVHELIIGCQQQRYSRLQAINVLCKNLHSLFSSFSK